MAAYEDNPDFVKGMNLSKTEIESFERFVDLVENARKDTIGFVDAQRVAFTPGALLAVAVARFAYELYRDYGKLAVSPAEFQEHFRGVVKQFNEFEALAGSSAGLDTYARLRRDLNAAKKGSK